MGRMAELKVNVGSSRSLGLSVHRAINSIAFICYLSPPFLEAGEFVGEAEKRTIETEKTGSQFKQTKEKQISLGMRHDGPLSDNDCDPGSYLMSPTLGSGKITWSPCSRHYLDLFLRTPQSHCLMDHSSSSILLDHNGDNTLPGERFNADQQCMLKYGRSSGHSATQLLSDICRDLHCIQDTHSMSSHPALEGTICGPNKWCRSGRCVDRALSRLHALYQPIAGGWSEWSPFSECASSCLYGEKTLESGSTGLMVSSRLCNNPWPENGGEPCMGSDKKFKTCFSNQCERISKTSIEDFAHEICLRAREFDRELTGTGFQKVSSNNAEDACTVWCQKEGGGIKSKGWTFPDGTTCQTHKQNVPMYCIGGVCQAFKCSESKENIFVLSPQRCSSPLLFSRDKRRQVSIGVWQPVSECYFNCISPARGLRLVEKKLCYNCNATANIQLCQPKTEHCGSMMKTTNQEATAICTKYKDIVSRLSGRGMQLSPSLDDPDRSCRLACQDENTPHRFYLVNGEEGWFPFGTDCSRRGTTSKAFCVSGRCLEFGTDDTPLHGSSFTLPFPRSKRRRKREFLSPPKNMFRHELLGKRRVVHAEKRRLTDFSVDYGHPVIVHEVQQ